MPAAAGEAGGVIEVVGAGALGVQMVVHGSVNQMAALGRTTVDGTDCSGSRLSIEWATGVFYGKGSGEQRGLQNQRRTSWTARDPF